MELFGKWGGGTLLARWTSNFDCKYETNWWYIVKDTPYDINSLKSKKRYVVKQGIRNFEVKIINPCEYKEELYAVQSAALSAYPSAFRDKLKKRAFFQGISDWTNSITYGAFYRETEKLCGYARLIDHGKYLSFIVQKTDPAFERYQINAAIVYQILEDYDERLRAGVYICDGEKNILHETAFQDYLEKYFGFRKAYCKLNVIYPKRIKIIVLVLYPFRNVLSKSKLLFFKQIAGVLKMEDIVRNEH